MPTALITGASSGLGEVFARKLAARGYELILTARREHLLQELAGSLPTRSRVISADLAKDSDLKTIAETIRATPDLEVLINNAGFGTKGRLWVADFERQIDMHQVHIMATLKLTRAALEGMVARRKGAVVNVSSVAAFSQSQGGVSYCATKAWMNSFTEGIALELRGVKSPVKMQALCPGFTHTGFHDALGADKSDIPKWLWLEADDVVEQSLASLETNRILVIPGWKYKLAATLLRHAPMGLRMRLKRPGKDRRI